jgi:cytoskeletal protein CcmA (bactofilin family)
MAAAAQEPCTIGSTVTVSGSVSGTQDLIVQGRIEGRVGLDSRLVVDRAGTVEAEIEVVHAEIHGAVKGNVVAKSALVAAGARMVGNLRAAQIVLEEGAQVSGNIEMDVDLPADVTVPAGSR